MTMVLACIVAIFAVWVVWKTTRLVKRHWFPNYYYLGAEAAINIGIGLRYYLSHWEPIEVTLIPMAMNVAS